MYGFEERKFSARSLEPRAKRVGSIQSGVDALGKTAQHRSALDTRGPINRKEFRGVIMVEIYRQGTS